MSAQRWRTKLTSVALLFAVGALATGPGRHVQAGSMRRAAATVDQPGLAVTPVLSNLPTQTVAARFGDDGSIFVAVKDGRVLRYSSASDPSPDITLDLRAVVNSYGDRGLLGLALDPQFTSGSPYLYVLYTLDVDPYDTTSVTPWWGDNCPNTAVGCAVSAIVQRFTIADDGAASDPLTLLDGVHDVTGGWCAQHTSHSIGTIAFGTDGALYVGTGDGASYTFADYGQVPTTIDRSGGGRTSTYPDPCNDHQGTVPRTGGRGAPLTAMTSRGGALRSQSVRGAVDGETISWDGTILRIDPETGAAAAGNPLIGNGIGGDDRIVAYGLRNPFRFTFRPGTNDLWLGDVGWNTTEEIDRFTTGPTQSLVPNFGWPCYEGNQPQGAYASLGTDLCTTLVASPLSSLGGVPSPLTGPVYGWQRYGQAGALPCTTTNGGGASTGGSFVANPNWPSALRGAYVFGDYARGCVVAMPLGVDGQPDPNRVTPLVSVVTPVDIQAGPDGDIYWIDIVGRTLNRLRPTNANIAPVASFTATPEAGFAPLDVQFDASSTFDPNGPEALTYAWDFDGDGACDDATGVTSDHTFLTPKVSDVTLCVTDSLGAEGRAVQQVQSNNNPPAISSLTTSADQAGWTVGDTVFYSTTATDMEDGELPPSAFTSTLTLLHCQTESLTGCHQHVLQTATGPNGSFITPDHDTFAALQLTMRVTDSGGLSIERTVTVVPKLSRVTVNTVPPGINVSAGPAAGPSPLQHAFLSGGLLQLLVPQHAELGALNYTFTGWSDAPTAPHDRLVTAPGGTASYVANYTLDTGRVLAVRPQRILDTRESIGGHPRRFAAGEAFRLQVGGEPGVPTGTTAVMVNVTAVDAGHDGFITAYPCDAVPTASNVNVVTGDIVANLATVALDPYGGICLFSYGDLDAVVDLSAMIGAAGGGYTGIAPVRVVDTREGLGAPLRRLQPGEVLRVPLGPAGVPADASAVLTNITVTNSTGPGVITAFPCAQGVPVASNLNHRRNQIVSNAALTELDGSGALCVTSLTAADLVIDVSGWVDPSSPSRMATMSPHRVVDTRESTTRLRAGETRVLEVDSFGAPPGAVAMIANVTAVDTAADGYFTLFPCASPARPTASNVNYASGEIRAIESVTAVGSTRRICLFSYAAADLVIDVQGWITPA